MTFSCHGSYCGCVQATSEQSHYLCDPSKMYQVYLMTDHANVGYSFGDNNGVVQASKVKDAVLDAFHAVNAACETGAVSRRRGI
jgi:hypothetical protein